MFGRSEYRPIRRPTNGVNAPIKRSRYNLNFRLRQSRRGRGESRGRARNKTGQHFVKLTRSLFLHRSSFKFFGVNRMYRLLFVALVLLLSGLGAALRAQTETPLILRNPAVSRDLVAFVFAGDLWVV